METESNKYSGKYGEASPEQPVQSLIVELIHRNHTFLACSHVHPDGDAVGSLVALGLYLEQMGKEVTMYSRDEVPVYYGFLDGAERIGQSLPEGKRFDVSFLLDCAGPPRVGEDFERFPGKGQLVIIDHHPPADDPGGLQLVRTGAASTTELLFDLMGVCGCPPTPRIATALLMGLMTDTGTFRFRNTSARAMAMGARLLEAGAEHALLNDRLYESYPAERYRLLGLVLPTLKFAFEGRVATIELTRAMYRETGCDRGFTEDFVDIPRSIAGVEVAILFREIDDEQYRVNLRSRGNVDVGKVASLFEGGGHPAAAGCTLRGSMERVYRIMLQAVGEALA